MESRKPGDGEMKMRLNTELMKKAREEADSMEKSGDSKSTISGIGGDESDTKFTISKKSEGIILGHVKTVGENNEDVFIGLDSDEK